MSKLVRDKIPDIIRQKGRVPVTHVAEDDEYWDKLQDKLKEEVHEFLKDGEVDELVDVLEVVHALAGTGLAGHHGHRDFFRGRHERPSPDGVG